MQLHYELIIFGYFLCLIFLTMILFSFIFNIITKRLFGTNPYKTKLYYFEMFLIWITMTSLMFYYKSNFNKHNKKKITEYIKFNQENSMYEDIYEEINNIEKFDIIVILGFIIIFVGSRHHSFNEKLSLLNEDIGIIAETI